MFMQEEGHHLQQRLEADAAAALEAAEAAAAAAEEEKTHLRGIWAAAEEQKRELEAKVARAAGCLKAADDLREARCLRGQYDACNSSVLLTEAAQHVRAASTTQQACTT